jgi:uracil phosphoribosyltransferase
MKCSVAAKIVCTCKEVKEKKRVKREEERLVGVEVLRAGDELVAVVEHRHA